MENVQSIHLGLFVAKIYKMNLELLQVDVEWKCGIVQLNMLDHQQKFIKSTLKDDVKMTFQIFMINV